MIPLNPPALEVGVALDALAADQSMWSQATFGTDSDRGPIGALRHLQKEAEEAERAAWDVAEARDGTDPDFDLPPAAAALATELADCLLLLLDASRRGGFPPLQLIHAAQAKMVLNRCRVWSSATGDVPTFHDKAAAVGES